VKTHYLPRGNSSLFGSAIDNVNTKQYLKYGRSRRCKRPKLIKELKLDQDLLKNHWLEYIVKYFIFCKIFTET